MPIQSHWLQNTVIERIWPEVNHRVNYPLKQVVIRMEEQGRINVDDRTTKFYVSFILVHVAGYSVSVFTQAWIMYYISGTSTCVSILCSLFILLVCCVTLDTECVGRVGTVKDLYPSSQMSCSFVCCVCDFDVCIWVCVWGGVSETSFLLFLHLSFLLVCYARVSVHIYMYVVVHVC